MFHVTSRVEGMCDFLSLDLSRPSRPLGKMFNFYESGF